MIVPYDYSYHDRLMPVLKQFFENSIEEYGIEMDMDRIYVLESSMANSSFLLIEGDAVLGVIGGFVTDSLLSKGKAYQEIIWYVDENHRSGGVKLLRHLEKWCESEGVENIIMARMHNSMPEKIGAFYERCGYTAMETQYIKNIS